MNENVYSWTVSDGEYKLIESSTGGLELYLLESDPYENDDLVAGGTAPAEKVEELQALAENIQQQE